jgi:DnaK suppressor protein
MEKSVHDKIKQKLEERQKELHAELSKIADETGVAVYEDIEDDEDVNAQEVSQYSDRLALAAELKKGLDDVTKSLAKLESDEYGKCKYCDKDINPERLLARPSSGSCVACKATLQGEGA